jgi:hypothetical protein
MRYPVRSVQVARETGTGPEAECVRSTLPTMWHGGALHPPVLLARVMPRLHKKLPTDAPQVGTSSCRALDVVTGFLPRMGQDILAWDWQAALQGQPASPGSEQGKEPSQAYRQSLPHHADATYVNLGTLCSSPERSRSACDQC